MAEWYEEEFRPFRLTEDGLYYQAVGTKKNRENIKASQIIEALDDIALRNKDNANKIKGIRLCYCEIDRRLDIEDARELERVTANGIEYIKLPDIELTLKITVMDGWADFNHVKFEGKVNLACAKFRKGANFSFAYFEKRADFTNACFGGYAPFVCANFKEEAYFNLVRFKEGTSFYSAKFEKDVYFQSVYFGKTTLFNLTEFQGNVVFTEKSLNIVSFKDCRFRGLGARAELSGYASNWIFDGAILDTVCFTDVNWKEERDKGWIPFIKVPFIKKRPYCFGELAIYDKTRVPKKLGFKPSFESAENVYRNVKQVYQRMGEYDKAGEFFYAEMECKRRQEKNWLPRLLWTFFYIYCGYGERPGRVIGVSVLFFLLMSVLFSLSGVAVLSKDVTVSSKEFYYIRNFFDPSDEFNYINYEWRGIKTEFCEFLKCLYFSVVTFTTLGYGDMHPLGFSRVLASFEAFFGAFSIAVFVLTFGRKMLR